MAQKKITDLTLRTDFDETCNMAADDPIQTWRVTGQQILNFMKANMRSSMGMMNLGLASSVAASAMTIALKQQNGSSDPASGLGAVSALFRSSTATSGAFVISSVTAAQSIVIPSGATLGTANNGTYHLWIYLMDNAGSSELAVSLARFPDGSIQSSTTISSGATSNSTLYSTTGRSNFAIRCIGRGTFSQSTAGAWANNFTELALTSSPGVLDSGRVAFSITGIPSGTINGSDNITIFPASGLLRDSHNAYNATTGIWTCPETREYDIYSIMSFTFTQALGVSFNYSIRKNSTVVNTNYQIFSNASVNSGTPSVALLGYPLTKGDTIDMAVNTNGSSPAYANVAAKHSMSISSTS